MPINKSFYLDPAILAVLLSVADEVLERAARQREQANADFLNIHKEKTNENPAKR